jgi:hypothetical protein
MPDEYRLEDIASDHLIGASVFIPFVIARLQGANRAIEALLTISLRNVGDTGERQTTLRLTWSMSNASAQPLGVPERTITEWAACGLACVVLARYTQARMFQVTGDGDRFDYWVSDGKHEYGLEVSGTMADEIETRHRAKVRQLQDNPYGVDGYVVVAGFTGPAVICSFHLYEEEVR